MTTSRHSVSDSPVLDKQDSESAFQLLHPALQEQLYQMRWTELRPIQVSAIRELIQGDGHLIVSAMTAGGKTEAAFLPILSNIISDQQSGVRVLYIGPLKALINDQFQRLELLCQRAEIPVHKWHGDVGAASKKELLKDPTGVLLITPESVESLFINRPQSISTLFRGLKYIVVDEMHSFMGTERGAHLKSLISRIERICGVPPRLVGLSATIGDIDLARYWLCPQKPEQVQVISGAGEKTIKYLIKGYLRSVHHGRDAMGDGEEATVETDNDRQLVRDLITAFYGKTALIFANSRKLLEFYADLSRQQLEKEGRPNNFRVHHGSLSKAEREDTENALKSDTPTVTFCSSTLELGIDVGNVSAVGQIGEPWSVSSLAQRLGRSGRRPDEPSVLLMYIAEDDPDEQISPVYKLCPNLIQGIAMTELLLDKWCEPPETAQLHLSTLVQQLLSVIAERGGSSAGTLYDLLIRNGAFKNVSHETFIGVLRSMGASDLIEQVPEGDLILGLTGENIVHSRDFYSAFASSPEMSVFHKGHQIGTIYAPPGLGADGYLILGGRRWKILSVDDDRMEIVVEPSRGGRIPLFAGGGIIDIHAMVRARMRDVLASDSDPIYLDAGAKNILKISRSFARSSGVLEQTLFKEGDDLYWFTWTSTQINRTLMGLGRFMAGMNVRDEEIALCFEKTEVDSIKRTYLGFLDNCPTAYQLAERFPSKEFAKYDSYLSEALLAENLAINSLDISGALDVIRSAFI